MLNMQWQYKDLRWVQRRHSLLRISKKKRQEDVDTANIIRIKALSPSQACTLEEIPPGRGGAETRDMSPKDARLAFSTLVWEEN